MKMGTKYPINEDFFDNINTEEKAYFLGFLYADGYRYKGNYEIGLNLHPKDKSILEKFSMLLHGQILVRDKRNKAHMIKDKYCPITDTVRFRFSNKHIADTLFKMGFTSEKSLTSKFPKIKNKVLKHFVRGYFDGDGCLSIHDGEEQVSVTTDLCCSSSFCDTLIKIIYKKLKIKCKKYKDGKIYRLKVYGALKSKIFMDWIYKDINICLERKREKYKKLLDYHNRKINGGFTL